MSAGGFLPRHSASRAGGITPIRGIAPAAAPADSDAMESRRTEDPSVVETQIVHDTHRRATALLAEAMADRGVDLETLVELRNFVVATLDHHHRCEDDDLWRIIAAAAPRLEPQLAGLSREHHELDAALRSLLAVSLDTDGAAKAVEVASSVRDLVHDHLAHEEPILFPALREHVTEQEWAAFSKRTVAAAPSTGIHLLVGLFYEVGSPQDVDLIIRHLPPDAQQRIPLMRDLAQPVLERLGAGGSRSAGELNR